MKKMNNPIVSAPTELKCQCDIFVQVEQEKEHLYLDEEKVTMNHKPNKCKGTYQIKKYKRNGKELWLCSACNLSGDKSLDCEQCFSGGGIEEPTTENWEDRFGDDEH